MNEKQFKDGIKKILEQHAKTDPVFRRRMFMIGLAYCLNVVLIAFLLASLIVIFW